MGLECSVIFNQEIFRAAVYPQGGQDVFGSEAVGQGEEVVRSADVIRSQDALKLWRDDMTVPARFGLCPKATAPE